MDSEDQHRQSLIYADGYSYTEVFQTPELSGISSGNRLISVFHAFFTADRDNDVLDNNPVAPKRTEIVSDR